MSTAARWGIGIGLGAAAVLTIAIVAAPSPARGYTRSPGPPKPGKADPSKVTTQLSATDAFDVRDPQYAWASGYTAKNITGALTRFAGAGGRALVLDISKAGGGPLPPHKSHQEGRDVDLTMVTKEASHAVKLALIRQLLAELLNQVDDQGDAAVTAIFLDRQIQEELYAAEPAGIVSESLQYPDREKVKTSRVWHWPGHVNHLHVRFRT